MIPPHDLDAERAVLGAILLSPPSLGPIQLDGGLRPGDFYSGRHHRIFDAILKLESDGRNIDQHTISAILAEGGGDACDDYLGELLATVPALSGVRDYARIVKDRASSRAHLQAAQEIQAAATSLDTDEPLKIARNMLESGNGSVRMITPEIAIEMAVEMSESPEPIERFPFPWPALNRLSYGGLRRGNLMVLGAWSNDGKSIIVDQMVADMCDKDDHKAGVYLGEMDDEERVARLIARHSSLPLRRVLQRPWSGPDIELAKDFKPPNVTFIPSPRWTVDRVCQHALRNRWDVVVIDTFRNLDIEPRVYGGMVQASEEAMSKLTALAKQARCVVVVVVHLSRPDHKDGKHPRPNAKHIRWGQVFEMDADVLAFLYRERDENNLKKLNAELYFEKGRMIETGSVDVRLDPDHMRFNEVTDDEW